MTLTDFPCPVNPLLKGIWMTLAKVSTFYSFWCSYTNSLRPTGDNRKLLGIYISATLASPDKDRKLLARFTVVFPVTTLLCLVRGVSS